MATKLTRRELLAVTAAPVVAAFWPAKAESAGPQELWDLRMVLYVPRIRDNMTSKGSRKYQRQLLRGHVRVTPAVDAEPEVEVLGLENWTHKVNGRRVAYEALPAENVLWHAIGNNGTGVFTARSVQFTFEAMPSYAIGPEPDEDNSLIVTLSGRSTAGGQRRLRGHAAGQIGCGCKEYGHVSPTRLWGQDYVRDTAAVFGTWSAKQVD